MPPRGFGGKKERPKNARGTLLRILRYIMSYRYVMLVLLVCTLASNVGNLLGPSFAGKAIGAAVGKQLVCQHLAKRPAAPGTGERMQPPASPAEVPPENPPEGRDKSPPEG